MGVFLAMLPGPAFFVLLQTSIKNGIRQAMAFDFGVLVADIIYIVIAFLFFAEVKALQSQEEYLKLAGGIVFLIFGTMLLLNKSIKFRKKKKSSLKEEKMKVKDTNQDENYIYLFLKGLFLNGFNPALIFFWFTVMAIGTDQVDAEGNRMFYYLTIILVTFFSIDLLKIFGANSLQRFITPKFLEKLNKIVGIIIIAIGTTTIIHSLTRIL